MMTPDAALDALAEAYKCPEVSMSETVRVIQRDAFDEGVETAIKALRGNFQQSENYTARRAILDCVEDVKKLKHQKS